MNVFYDLESYDKGGKIGKTPINNVWSGHNALKEWKKNLDVHNMNVERFLTKRTMNALCKHAYIAVERCGFLLECNVGDLWYRSMLFVKHRRRKNFKLTLNIKKFSTVLLMYTMMICTIYQNFSSEITHSVKNSHLHQNSLSMIQYILIVQCTFCMQILLRAVNNLLRTTAQHSTVTVCNETFSTL